MGIDTSWFAARRWGVFCHYLGAAPSTAGGADLTAAAWNGQIDAFDLQGLVAQLVEAGAPYLVLTIGQNSGHFLGPNPTYDHLTGIEPSKCSRRDLVLELAAALAPHDIDLLVYLPSGAPAADPVAVERLGWQWGYEGGWPAGGGRTGARLADFQTRWESIVRDWSGRWGSAVKGWWIDGCYFADEMYRHPEPPNFASFAAALRSGNPQALVAFNPGVVVPVVCHTECEDFTAGEISNAFPECPGSHVGGARYHVLSYLGSTWCGGSQPRFPDAFVAGYTEHVNQRGGVVTWDVPIGVSGLIPEAFTAQLAHLARAIGGKSGP